MEMTIETWLRLQWDTHDYVDIYRFETTGFISYAPSNINDCLADTEDRLYKDGGTASCL